MFALNPIAPDDVGVVVAAHAHLVVDPASKCHPCSRPALAPISEQMTNEVWFDEPVTSTAAELLRRCCHGPLPRRLSGDVLELVLSAEFRSAFLDVVLCHVDTTLTAHLVVATIGAVCAMKAIVHALANRELHAVLMGMAARGRVRHGVASRVFRDIRTPHIPVAIACGALAGVRPPPIAAGAPHRATGSTSTRPTGHTVCTLARGAHRYLNPGSAIDALGGNVTALGGAAAEWFSTPAPKRRRPGTPAPFVGLGAALDLAIVPTRADTESVCVICTTCRATRTPIRGLPAKRKRSGIVLNVAARRQLCGYCMSDSLVPIRLKHNFIVHRGRVIGGCTACSKVFVGTGMCATCTKAKPDRPCFARCRTKAITTAFVAKANGRICTFYACPRHCHCIPSTVEDIVAIGLRYGISV